MIMGRVFIMNHYGIDSEIYINGDILKVQQVAECYLYICEIRLCEKKLGLVLLSCKELLSEVKI